MFLYFCTGWDSVVSIEVCAEPNLKVARVMQMGRFSHQTPYMSLGSGHTFEVLLRGSVNVPIGTYLYLY